MLLDITLQVTPAMLGKAWGNTDKALVGHLGTHFDVMDKEFPLEYTSRPEKTEENQRVFSAFHRAMQKER